MSTISTSKSFAIVRSGRGISLDAFSSMRELAMFAAYSARYEFQELDDYYDWLSDVFDDVLNRHRSDDSSISDGKRPR